MNQESNFDQIERYLFHQMEQPEKEQFEQALTENDALQAEVQLHQLEHQALERIDQLALDAQFADWKTEKNQQSTTTEVNTTTSTAKVVQMNTRRSFRKLAIAASFVLAIGVGLNIWTQANYSNSGLAQDYFPRTSFSDKSNVASENPLLEVLELMETAQYEAAIAATASLENTPFAEQALLLKAEAALLNEDAATAISTYDQLLIDSESATTRQKAEWGKALALLESENEESAREILDSIATNSAHLYQQEATNLQAELGSFWRRFVW